MWWGGQAWGYRPGRGAVRCSCSVWVERRGGVLYGERVRAVLCGCCVGAEVQGYWVVAAAGLTGVHSLSEHT